MIIFIPPIAIVASKIIAGKVASRAIGRGAQKAGESISDFIVKRLCNVVVNAVVLTIAVFIMPILFQQDTSHYLICSVYLATIIHGLWEFIKNLSSISEYVIKHRLNLKAFLVESIYEEARERIRNEVDKRSFLTRMWFSLFGPSPDEMARQIAREAAEKVLFKVLTSAVAVVIYVAIFRLMIAPILIGDATNLGFFGSAVYPLLAALDYFFCLHLVAILE